MRYIQSCLLLLLLTVFLIPSAGGQEVIRLNKNNINKYIGKDIAIFQDTTSSLSFEDVYKDPSLFQVQDKLVPNLGISHYNSWIRFKMVNEGKLDKVALTIEYPSIDFVNFYLIRNGRVKEVAVSKNDLYKNRTYNHQFYIFDIPLEPGDSITCFLKLNSNTQLLAPITLNSSNSILNAIAKLELLTGLYFGIMLVMIFYNLFIYFSSRDKSYLVYVNYIFWVLMAQASLLGFSNKYLWPSNLWLVDNSMVLTAAMSGIASIQFVKSFLDTRLYARKFNWVLNFILLAEAAVITILLLGYDLLSYQLVNTVAGFGAVTIFITACVVLSKKRKPAIFFLIAWSIFLTSVVVFVFNDFGIFNYNFFTTHAMQIGSAIEAVLLSFALADKINVLKKEKDQSRLAALRIAKENSRIVKEQNVVLEIKVKKRTEEIEHKNEELNQTLSDLQQAQMQLVESEKMASLGQLTAGIAHEINNPINFVTGNIGPLKRDVEVLFEAINMLERYNKSDMPDEVKIKQFALFKDEQDFDYLKIEINHLLKGINEGATRTAEIVKSLRIFSRLDEDDLKLADVNEGLESTLIIVNNLLSGINVIKQYGDLPLINCYPGKLNQVFLNIISNALYAIDHKYEKNSGGELLVETYKDDSFVYIVIKDNGIGMSEEVKRKMFDPFFTTKDVGQGTGLGMSIAFNTIQKHNGNIEVISEVGVGTTFKLQLPLI